MVELFFQAINPFHLCNVQQAKWILIIRESKNEHGVFSTNSNFEYKEQQGLVRLLNC